MSATNTDRIVDRQTTADEVFQNLRNDIVSLKLAPGAKLSEAEVARQNGVSRQPVREAFIRLSKMGLLRIRPQRATIVRKISRADLLNARFVRTAVEVEVVLRACAAFDNRKIGFNRNLKQQEQAVARGDAERFHQLDYDFHHLLCVAAGTEFAYETIAENKAQVDRLCMISLADQSGMEALLQDHSTIFKCLETGDAERIVRLTRLHLSRLDQTLAAASEKHPEYFDE